MSTKVTGPLSATNVVAYHHAELAANYAQTYYSESGRANGVWFGKQCAALGLHVGAPVAEDHFTRLANGQHAITGEQLIRWKPTAEKGPEWATNDQAWVSHVNELLLTREGGELLVSSDHTEEQRTGTGRVVDPIPSVRTARETALLEMHAIARQTYIDCLYTDSGAGAREYLASRGIRSKTAAEFGLGLSNGTGHQLVDRLRHYGPDLMRASGLFIERPDHTFYDRFRDRLMFPIENAYGETIAFGGRRSPGDQHIPTYINSAATEIYDKSATLYNLHRAAGSMQYRNKAIVVEGYMDALAVFQSGRRNVVALGGTAFTPEHAAQLQQRVDNVVLNLDEDQAGRSGAEKAVHVAIQSGMAPSVVSLDADPAKWLETHSPKEYKAAIRDAAPVVQYWATRAMEIHSQIGIDAEEPFPGARYAARREAERWFQSALGSVPPAQRIAIDTMLRAHLGLPPEQSTEAKASEHRAAWDITFSAGKSISLTALVGGDARLVAAHDEAVQEALTYAERAIQVKMGGLHAPQTTGRMVAALYRHDTARPVDGYAAPQLHTHAVVFNMSQDVDRQFRALNPTELYRLQSAMESVYQSRLGFRAREFGYHTTHSAYHATEIQGYTREYLDAEGQRREQIKAEKSRLGQYGPHADSLIALNTRAEKLTKTPAEIQAMHQAHAEQYGHQAQHVVSLAHEHRNRMLSPRERAKEADRAVEYARTRLSERTTVMEWYEVDRDALRLAQGRYTLEDVSAAVERAHKQGRFQEVSHWRSHAPEVRYTTPELQAKEHYILGWMVAGKGKSGAIAGNITKDEFRHEFRDNLNDGQKHLVWNLIHSEDRMVGVQGFAGTGKTRALGVLKTFAEDYGFEVHGVAATGGASKEMSKVRICANTLSGFMLEPEPGRLPRLYLLDEASLADVHQMAAFLERLRDEDRVVVIGDVKQHGSVGAGRVFAELQEAGMQTYRLKTIMRQQADWYKDVVKQLSRAEITPAIEALEQHSRIHEYPNEAERQKAMASYYVVEPWRTLGIAPDNRARALITEHIREERRTLGQLGEVRYEGRVLVARSDIQKEDLKYAINYNPGDVLAYEQRTKMGLQKGDRASVMQVDVDRNLLTVMREQDGKVFAYNPRRVGTAVGVYEPTYREFSVGDRVQFTKNLPHKVVTNRSLGTITALSRDGAVAIALDERSNPDGSAMVWRGELDKMPYIDWGYVMTSYSAQGASAYRVLIHMDTDAPQTSRMLTQQLAYVAASRGSQDIHIFTNDIEELKESLQRSEEAPMALSPAQRERYREAVEAIRETVGQGRGV